MITTREDLIHVLTEAAEIEHNLLCSYLYATFSLKRTGEGSLTVEQGVAVEAWRKLILSVAIEEMAHLATVNNLLLAVGGAAHFDRPNLPVAPGYHPSGIVVRLAPFTPETLDHFIFLERPKCDRVSDGDGFERKAADRKEIPNSLTPSAINYDTVGDLYDAVSEALRRLSETLGETQLFSHGGRGQLDAKQTGLSFVTRIGSLSSALEAVELIKEQGEGSSGSHEDCHFDRFQGIKEEWTKLLENDPQFEAAWPAAHDPVMRRPLTSEERVWIYEAPAAGYLDCANAAYGLMLIILQQAFSLDTAPLQTPLMKLAVAVMELASVFGNALVRMPAGASYAGINAGMTFAVPRNLGMRVGSMLLQLHERLDILEAGMTLIATGSETEKVSAALRKCRRLIPSGR